MAIHYRTQAIFLKKENLGETDQLFTVFTKDFGKLKILGKAIRKIKSKLRGGAEIFYFSEIEFIQGKTYKILTDAISIENFVNIRKKPKRLKIAYLIAQVLDDLIKGPEKDEKIWNLLIESFKQLNTSNLKSTIYNLQYYYFLWNLISILGYEIDLYYCVLCQKKLKPEALYFDPEEGGIICKSCSKITAGTVPVVIKPEVIKILRIISKKDWQMLKRLKIDKPILNSLERVSESYFNYLSKK